jgi:thioredoxin 1
MSDFIEVTDDSYQDFIDGRDGLLLFYKAVCPHCKAIKKVLERFHGQNDTAAIAQIDSENNPKAMEDLGIERVPTMLVTKGGQEVLRKVGLFNVKELSAMYSQA